MTDTYPDFTLNDGRTMPRLGMGTYQIADAQVAMVVRKGLDLGYRLVDTAAIYRNERGVGEGYRGESYEDGGAFLTTKLWNDRHDDVEAALDESLALLGVDAVDLYLMHWPVPTEDRFVAAWTAMIGLRDAGKARSIGVSNFLPVHLDRLKAETGVVPAVNQIELHPHFQQVEARAYHEANGIVTQSWSPIGQGKGLLDDETIAGIAARHHRSAAQIVLAWHLAHGLSVIPKASGAEHLSDNLAALDLRLDADDVAAIDALDRADGRLGPDPLTFG